MAPAPGSLGPSGAARAPGSFSATVTPVSNNNTSNNSNNNTTTAPSRRPAIRRVDTDSSDDIQAPLLINKQRSQNANANIANAQAHRPSTPQTRSTTTYVIPNHPNNSTSSLQNFSRPSAAFARGDAPSRTNSPLSGRPTLGELSRTHTRKHSQSQGFFEPSLPTSSFLPSNIGGLSATNAGTMAPTPPLSASQIAAQAAMHVQNQQMRQRSQTLPQDNSLNGSRRPSTRGPASPPLLSVTEASGERQSAFGRDQGQQIYRNGLLGGGTSAATTAANIVFPRSPQTSPVIPSSPDFTKPYREPEKTAKPEKTSKVKLFSRPGKISTKTTQEKPMPSPSKFAQSMQSLQRSNPSTNSLNDNAMSSASSMYSMANSSSATIRPADMPLEKEKEKKHNFLSRQKHKLSAKDDHHLPLSSAASNSRPMDPSAPSSLYNFILPPPSPGPASTSFSKSMSGLDLRHGGRALREKKKEEKAAAGTESAQRESEVTYSGSSEWPGPASIGSAATSSLGLPSAGLASSVYGNDIHQELAKYGLNNMNADDAWPFLKAKLLIVFEGEDLRLPVEDFNRLVSLHLQRCIQKRAPNLVIEDVRELLTTGFSSLDLTMRRTPEERLIPHLVEMWMFTFTSILPYMQAVFLPLDLEFSGNGPLMSAEMARDFWGALPPSSRTAASNVPATQLLEIRRIVLTTYRDVVILPRFDTLKTIFSRLSLESINSNLNLDALSSSPSSGRPGTAMSLDPSTASYNSQTTTLLSGTDSAGARSRAISNVSFGSDRARDMVNIDSATLPPPPPVRPFTPSTTHPSLLGPGLSHTISRETLPSQGHHSNSGQTSMTLAQQIATQRETNNEDGKVVTETVGRMLQCMSVLASVGVVESAGASALDEEAQEKMEDLCRTLKLNWLGRGRTGRNRRGFVGAKLTNRSARGAVVEGGGTGMGGFGESSML